MVRLLAPILWVYDFLAEDVVLLAGTALAIVVAIVAVKAAHNAAGIILFFVVVAVITTSLWRARQAGHG